MQWKSGLKSKRLALLSVPQLERPNILNRQYGHVFTVTALTASRCLQRL
jgi:hypothetical protein